MLDATPASSYRAGSAPAINPRRIIEERLVYTAFFDL
jgi:hypothetical protein